MHEPPPLTPAVFHVLWALAEGELHGYGIMQHVRQAGAGRVKMGPGTLYGTLQRLESQGLIEESAERPDPDSDDDRRRYYALTKVGRAALEAEAERLSQIVERLHDAEVLP